MNNITPTTKARYKSPIPPNIEIVGTKPELAKIQHANLGALLSPENGGYYLKYPESKVVAIASDRLCSVLDDSYLSLLFNFEREGLHQEAEEVMEDLRKGMIDADTLKRDASVEIKSGACILDGDLARDAGDDGQRPKAPNDVRCFREYGRELLIIISIDILLHFDTMAHWVAYPESRPTNALFSPDHSHGKWNSNTCNAIEITSLQASDERKSTEVGS